MVTALRGMGLRVDALVRHSKGASAALMYARKYGGVARVVSVAGRFAMGRGVRERFGEEAVRRTGSGERVAMRASASDGRGGKREVQLEVGEEEIGEREAVDYGGRKRRGACGAWGDG